MFEEGRSIRPDSGSVRSNSNFQSAIFSSFGMCALRGLVRWRDRCCGHECHDRYHIVRLWRVDVIWGLSGPALGVTFFSPWIQSRDGNVWWIWIRICPTSRIDVKRKNCQKALTYFLDEGCLGFFSFPTPSRQACQARQDLSLPSSVEE